MLNAVSASEGVDEAEIRKPLLDEFAIEIGAGLGQFKGKAWRIGLMGESATERHVTSVLNALETVLVEKGILEEMGKAVTAATEVYES